MKMKAGLWIDHKKAVIVFVDDKSEKKVVLKSNLEKIVGLSSNKGPFASFGRRDFPKYDIVSRDFTGHLNNYYDMVSSQLKKAAGILIFGPGQPKNELVKRMGKNKISGLIKKKETAGKMTDAQIAAKVRRFFFRRAV